MTVRGGQLSASLRKIDKESTRRKKISFGRTPEFKDWTDVQGISLAVIDTRIVVDSHMKLTLMLCNHAGGGCDCENHPTPK